MTTALPPPDCLIAAHYRPGHEVLLQVAASCGLWQSPGDRPCARRSWPAFGSYGRQRRMNPTSSKLRRTYPG
eukprot:364207-Chlamydomonas_euryale.AAC.6